MHALCWASFFNIIHIIISYFRVCVLIDRKQLSLVFCLLSNNILLQGLYSVARSAGAVMFESNIHCNYAFLNGSGLVSDHLAEFKKVPDESVLTTESVAMGFDCGVPPNPRVSYCACVRGSVGERGVGVTLLHHVTRG